MVGIAEKNGSNPAGKIDGALVFPGEPPLISFIYSLYLFSSHLTWKRGNELSTVHSVDRKTSYRGKKIDFAQMQPINVRAK